MIPGGNTNEKGHRCCGACSPAPWRGAPLRREFLEEWEIPSYGATRSNRPLTFANSQGYDFIGYLHSTCGWDAVLRLLRTEDYSGCFGKTQEQIYREWVTDLQNYPQ